MLIHKLKLIIYYTIISKLPNSRFLKLSNSIRIFYLSHVLEIISVGENSIFEENVYISDAKNISVGVNSQINEGVFLQGAMIGKNVLIAPNTAILNDTHNHKDINVPIILQGMTEKSNPVIEDNVWIGRSVIIMPGVKIGEGSIVGAGSVVTKNIAPYTVNGGVPARLISNRT